MKANRPLIVRNFEGNVRHKHRTETSDNRPMFHEKRPISSPKPAYRNLPIIYRCSRRIYRFRVSSWPLSVQQSTYNRPILSRNRPISEAKAYSHNLSIIYHLFSVIYRSGRTRWATFPQQITPGDTPTSPTNRQERIANRQLIGKRLSLIGKESPIVRSLTGQLQLADAESVASDTGKVPTVSEALHEVKHD